VTSIKRAYDSSVASLQQVLQGENLARRKSQEQQTVLHEHVERLHQQVCLDLGYSIDLSF